MLAVFHSGSDEQQSGADDEDVVLVAAVVVDYLKRKKGKVREGRQENKQTKCHLSK